ncbi:MAG: hypothetical protein AB7R55_01635 [Gemmatimonadales bacterium]
MPPVAAAVAILLACDARAGLAGDADQHLENVSFRAPPGWIVQRTEGAVSLSPPDLRGPETLMVSLLRGRTSSASLESELDRSWSEVLAIIGAAPMTTVHGRRYDLDEPGRSLLGWDYLHASGGVRRPDGSFNVDLYQIRAGERLERVVVLARDFRDNLTTTSASRNPVYARAIRELVFCLRFASLPTPPRSPPRLSSGDGRDRGISGVWTGLAMSFGRIKRHFAIFFEDGTGYFGPRFPERGLLEIDPAVEQPSARRSWGAYTMTGASGTLTMPYGAVSVWIEGGGLELTTNGTLHRFIRLVLPSAEALEGDWCLAGGQCLRLTAAGRFEDRGAVRAIEHASYPNPETPVGGDGSFGLEDYTLVLRYDRGPEIRVGFAGVADERASRPAELLLGFNADVLTRR